MVGRVCAGNVPDTREDSRSVVIKKLMVHVVMSDGTIHDTETRSADYVAFEAEAKKRGWGTLQESPSTWESYVSYRALIRGRLISMPFGDPASPAPGSFMAEAEEVEASPQPEAEPFPQGDARPTDN